MGRLEVVFRPIRRSVQVVPQLDVLATVRLADAVLSFMRRNGTIYIFMVKITDTCNN